MRFRPMRKGLAGAAAGALALTVLPFTAAGAGTAEACAAAPLSPDFDDVDESGGTYGEVIACVAGYDIVGGYPDNTFQPANDVTRAQAAAFLTNFVETAQAQALPVPSENPFTDVDADGVYGEVILKLHEAGIIDGATADTFEPGGNLTRGQMAKIVANALEHVGVTLNDPAGSTFDDVPEGGTFEEFIDKLADAGIVEGDGTGAYNPGDNVRRGQLTAFVAASAGAADDADLWDPTRLIGPVPTADPATAQATTGIEVTVTVYDENGDPVSGTAVDAFAVDADDNFNDDGSPNYAGDVTIDDGGLQPAANSTGFSQGQLDPEDPTTGEEGTVTLTLTSATAQDVDFIVWTGAQGDTFANADVTADNRGSTVLRWTPGPASVAMDANRDTNTYPYGEDPQLTATLVDPDGNPVALEGETIGYTVTEGGDPITGGEEVASGTATTDASGTATFSYTAPTDPDAESDNSTAQTVTAFWDQDGDGSQGDQESTTGTIELTFDDEPAGTVADATLAFPDTDATSTTGLVGTDHTVQVTVTDTYGDPVEGVTANVQFSIQTDASGDVVTDAAGMASVTWTGPAAADKGAETITATVDTGDDGDAGDDSSMDTAPAELTRNWVEIADDAEDDTSNGGGGQLILTADTSADRVSVDGDFFRYSWQSDDTFQVDGTEATQAEFEQALDDRSDQARLSVDFEPGAASTFNLISPSQSPL